MKFKPFWAPSSPLSLALLSVLCLPLLSPAQQNKLAILPGEEVIIKRGASATANLKVMTLPGFHVNSDKPADQYVIAMQLTWTPGPLQASAVTYPKAEELKVGSETLSVFAGTFNIQTQFKAPSAAVPGTSVMTGKLHYQACNNQMCFRPSTIEVRVPVRIE